MVSCDPSEALPCVTIWPRGASRAFLEAVRAQYFGPTCGGNRFQYSLLLHKAETIGDALHSFSRAGAFATHAARSALLDVLREARAHLEWCKPEVLNELERYATYAFVLDGTVMTCGILCSAEPTARTATGR